jgi:hypothetical protein
MAIKPELNGRTYVGRTYKYRLAYQQVVFYLGMNV